MKKIIQSSLILIIIILYIFHILLGRQISYFSAHVACGNYFLSERPISMIKEQEGNTKPFNIDWVDNIYYKLLNFTINDDDKTISVAFALFKTTMKFYPNYGCSIDLNKKFLQNSSKPSKQHSVNINNKVQSLIAKEFVEDEGNRAIAIMHGDNIVGEYFDEFTSSNTPLLSWSMTKSITSLLFGRLITEGLIEIDDKVFPYSSSSYKRSLTYRHLLNHVDGLDYQEAYYPFTDFFNMLMSKNIGNHLSQLDFKYAPGEHWAYSSAATNLLTYKISEIGNKLGYSIHEMFQYFLFDELEIYDAVIAKDSSGNMIASSFGFISPTAWLSIGKLMKNEGAYEGKQIINKEFIEFMITPVTLNNGKSISNYGGQWWLNTNNPEVSPELYDVSNSIFSANGFQGQRLLIIPDLDLIILRMGLTDGRTEWNNEGSFVKEIIKLYTF